jgi:hypothetical protein
VGLRTGGCILVFILRTLALLESRGIDPSSASRRFRFLPSRSLVSGSLLSSRAGVIALELVLLGAIDEVEP